ncbi:Uncharacterized protein dnm_076400 [Desulfonema magnum]|uniref:Uncharacterized protein n=1 Tax=Desulfonema magnum TaxID=45655 RepID=A0A975BUV3_9BACT|nr:Uncharacterized protein dnm_076400 [Desulfonema magnum]
MRVKGEKNCSEHAEYRNGYQNHQRGDRTERGGDQATHPSEGAKEMALTVAEQIRREARRESIKKIALNMLNMRMDIKQRY